MYVACFFSLMYMEHGSIETSSVSSCVVVDDVLRISKGLSPYLTNVLRPLHKRYAKNFAMSDSLYCCMDFCSSRIAGLKELKNVIEVYGVFVV